MSFERAWDSAFSRVRWPHDTPSRQGWKQQLADDREVWRAAYENAGPANKPLLALHRLLCEYSTDDSHSIAA